MPAKLTTETFIEKAKAIHGKRYDYSMVKYEHARAPVKVLCPKHGLFEQRAGDHLQGKGCPECGRPEKYTKDVFVEKARKIHEDKYGYDAVTYNDIDTKVAIICHKPNHGIFSQTPHSHLQGHGCPRCCGVHSYSTSEFIARAKEVHGDKYGYDKVQYTAGHVKTVIFCKTHKTEFEQTPASHLQGRGCPSCADYGYRTTLPGSLYLLQSGPHLKIGITNREVKDRLAELNRERPFPFSIIKIWKFEDGEKALKTETMALSLFRLRYKQPEGKLAGFTETFVADDVNHFISTLESIVDSIK